MKAVELRRHSTCSLCETPIGQDGSPLFWRVTVERFSMDRVAVGRQDGLANLVGSRAVAEIIGPDHDLARSVIVPRTITLCDRCGLDSAAITVAMQQPLFT